MAVIVSSMKDDAEKGGGTAKAKVQVPFVKEVFKGGCRLRGIYSHLGLQSSS